MVNIVKATPDDIDLVVPLFDEYRIFYGKNSDRAKAKEFLTARFSNKENILFLAFEEGKAVAFTQLYPTFSSVSMQSFYILNDLFVDPDYRNKGIAGELLKTAQAFCREKRLKGLALETAVDNPAQKLYERLGWKKDEAFLHYFWSTS